jgi:uncharacterized membrane protein YhaH (DUF805 family)
MTDERTQEAFNFLDLSGRASRAEFAIVLALWLVAVAMVSTWLRATPAVGLGVGAVLSAPLILTGVRRLHDRDQSGWWMLISFTPLIGLLFLAMLAVAPQDMRTNRFGPPPRLGR